MTKKLLLFLSRIESKDIAAEILASGKFGDFSGDEMEFIRATCLTLTGDLASAQFVLSGLVNSRDEGVRHQARFRLGLLAANEDPGRTRKSYEVYRTSEFQSGFETIINGLGDIVGALEFSSSGDLIVRLGELLEFVISCGTFAHKKPEELFDQIPALATTIFAYFDLASAGGLPTTKGWLRVAEMLASHPRCPTEVRQRSREFCSPHAG